MFNPTSRKRWCLEERIYEIDAWVPMAHFETKGDALQAFEEVEDEIDMYGVPLHTPYRVRDKTTQEIVCYK